MTQRVTPKLDYEHPYRPRKPEGPPPPPEKFWSPRKWKLYLLAGWCACTAFWVPISYERTHMQFAVDAYKLYWHYETQVQTGRNPTYARRGYKKAVDRLEDADPYLMQFLLSGILSPLLILGGGAWLLRKAK